MEVTNRGYINFNNEYNKHTQDYTTASMSFANGKNEDGSYKHGYIRVIAYGELGNVLYDNVGNMVTIKGRFRQSEYEGKKYSQIRIDAINGYAPAQNQNNGNNVNFGNNQRHITKAISKIRGIFKIHNRKISRTNRKIQIKVVLGKHKDNRQAFSKVNQRRPIQILVEILGTQIQ